MLAFAPFEGQQSNIGAPAKSQNRKLQTKPGSILLRNEMSSCEI